jgi:hypothetical protein
MNIVIVGARERNDSETDKEVVEGLIRKSAGTYGRRLNVISVGCDKGVGKIAREFCIQNEIIFVECRMKLEGKDIPRSFFVHVFQARNPALVMLGDYFHIFKGPNENGIVESVVNLAVEKVGAERVFIYAPDIVAAVHPEAPKTLDEMAVDMALEVRQLLSESSKTGFVVAPGAVEAVLKRLLNEVKHKLADWM